MQVQKAIEISDAKIQFVSLVDKAANNKQFLITKAENGSAQFSTYGKILKANSDTHFITGIVYEPLVEDAQGNFMTESEIEKAAHWFAKNGDKVDLQHSYEAIEGASVVESYIVPCDMVIGDTPVIKGTWVMTVEVTNAEVWNAVQKGEITGFSMGGFGKYSEEDVSLEGIGKAVTAAEKATEKKGILKGLAKVAGFFGLDVVEKGAMADAYKESMRSSGFWNAFYALEDILYRYNWVTDRYEFQTDEATIREVLSDFNAIIIDMLAEKNISKALLVGGDPVNKSGKKISNANKKRLDDAYQILTELRGEFEEAASDDEIEKEDSSMTEETIKQMIDDAITKAVSAQSAPAVGATENKPFTEESVQKMIDESIKKAFEASAASTSNGAEAGAAEQTESALTAEAIQKMIGESVEKAIAPILKARALPSNLNGEPQTVEKSNDVFAGFFTQS